MNGNRGLKATEIGLKSETYVHLCFLQNSIILKPAFCLRRVMKSVTIFVTLYFIAVNSMPCGSSCLFCLVTKQGSVIVASPISIILIEEFIWAGTFEFARFVCLNTQFCFM